VEASIHRDVTIAEEALNLLQYQRETWVMLMEKLAEDRGTGSETSPQPAAAGQPDANYHPLSVEG
jgi:hypothetical protein